MNIHPAVIISSGVKLGSGVKVGAFSIIYDNVQIGDYSEIRSHCEIGIKTTFSDGYPLIIVAATKPLLGIGLRFWKEQNRV